MAWCWECLLKPGLRLQIVCLIASLLVLGFVPLYLGVERYTEAALHQTRVREALQTSQRLAESLARLQPGALREQLQTLTSEPQWAAATLSARAEPSVYFGDPLLRALLLDQVAAQQDGERRSRIFQDAGATYVLAYAQPSPAAPQLALLSTLGAPNPGALNRLLGVYVGLIGSALLLGVYFTVTRWIIRPLDQLTRSASRVAVSRHPLQLPSVRSREFVLLANSLSAMTDQLLREEAILRNKIRELEAARDELRTAQAQLVRSERLASVGQLAAGLAHELGNPIAAIVGLQDLILESELAPEQQLDFVRRMRAETDRISRILRDLLQFARPAAEPSGDSSGAGSLHEALGETLALLKPQPMLKELSISAKLPERLPLVRLGTHQLTQVLLNLLLNAAAACRGRGSVQISATQEPGWVRLLVHDDGPGVAPELRATLFEPFVSSKEVGEGSGLGLSVCRGLIEGVGGTIELDSSTTDGACFIVRLPAISEGKLSAPKAEASAAAPPGR